MDILDRLEQTTKELDKALEEADEVLNAVEECHLKLVTSTGITADGEIHSKESLYKLMNSVERSNDRWNRGKHKDVQ